MVEVSIKTKGKGAAWMRHTQIFDNYKISCEKHGESEKALWVGSLGADICIKCLREAIEQET